MRDGSSGAVHRFDGHTRLTRHVRIGPETQAMGAGELLCFQIRVLQAYEMHPNRVGREERLGCPRDVGRWRVDHRVQRLREGSERRARRGGCASREKKCKCEVRNAKPKGEVISHFEFPISH